ncbi:hypothetical protein CC86DRAFT_68881 [Ophiobolus disseminans]|uniref:Uncharacterized protein n=1 Tax=Ophiobolus disseminans TaxID=1469910 RepID=A0A6A6ZT69_9PLEO|nr:hypothetical protein CC86DRAFT_68881 [Ophiobolus disseminans]
MSCRHWSSRAVHSTPPAPTRPQPITAGPFAGRRNVSVRKEHTSAVSAGPHSFLPSWPALFTTTVVWILYCLLLYSINRGVWILRAGKVPTQNTPIVKARGSPEQVMYWYGPCVIEWSVTRIVKL